MNVKLTLSINEKTIERAKRISRQKGKSISKMVEEYLDGVNEKETKKSSSVKELSGILKGKVPASVNWKKVKENYLIKKYDL